MGLMVGNATWPNGQQGWPPHLSACVVLANRVVYDRFFGVRARKKHFLWGSSASQFLRFFYLVFSPQSPVRGSRGSLGFRKSCFSLSRPKRNKLTAHRLTASSRPILSNFQPASIIYLFSASGYQSASLIPFVVVVVVVVVIPACLPA